MIQKMFAVRDVKALAFLQPFFSAQAGSAIRAFDDACNDGKSPFSNHPEDYILYEIGLFDDESGACVPVAPIKMLGCGSDFRRFSAPVPVNPKEVVSNGKEG